MLPQLSKAASNKQMTCSRSKPRERQEQPNALTIRVLQQCI